MEDTSLAVSNLTLAIVDTPGFFDDNGEGFKATSCQPGHSNHAHLEKKKISAGF